MTTNQPEQQHALPVSEETDVKFMELALAEARAAGQQDEVPVGAVLVLHGEVLAAAGNRVITDCDPSAHAESLVIRAAASKLGNYRLLDTTLYVTLEPCSMCAGLLVHSRVGRLVFGAADPKTGAAGSVMNLVEHPELNHQLAVTRGVLGAECGQQLSAFFRERRKARKALKRAAQEFSSGSGQGA